MNYFYIRCFFLLVVRASSGSVLAEKQKVVPLVDVSGNMKHNDPGNWHVPTLLTIFTFSTNLILESKQHQVNGYIKLFKVETIEAKLQGVFAA